MSTDTEPSGLVHGFQVAGGDVRHLWEAVCRQPCRGLSPFVVPPDAGPASAPVGAVADLEALGRNPVFATTAAILADPDLELEGVIGGGGATVGHVALYRRREVDASRVVAVTPSAAGSHLLQVFDDAAAASRWLAGLVSRIPDFVTWDHDTMSYVGATLEEPRGLPADMAFETLIYLLHAIDLFRRAAYRSLLDHEPIDGTVLVEADVFDSTLSRSLHSGDVRWLLPAFQRMTPGLSELRVEPQAAHLEVLRQYDVLRPGRRLGTDEAVYAFGEVGTRVGIEFYRTWHSAAAVVLHRRGDKKPPRQSWFVAPTAFTNHLFAVQRGGDGRGRVHHEALDEAGLARAVHAALDAPPVG